MNVKNIIKVGKEAKQRLEDPLFKAVLKEMRDACYYNIEHSNYRSKDEREDLYHMMRCISKFEEILIKMMEDGKLAADEKMPAKVRKLIR